MQQPPPPPPTPVERRGLPKGLKLLFVLVGVLVIMTAGIAYANRWFFSYVTSTSPHAITYQVTGNGTARVAYQTPEGRQTDTVALPWEVTVTVPDGSALAVVATGEYITSRASTPGSASSARVAAA